MSDVKERKRIELGDTPPFKRVCLQLDDGFMQAEAGHYPDNTGRRLATYAKRVYADEGGEAVLALLDDLADMLSGGSLLPLWERGEYIPGYKEAFGYDDTA